MASGLILALMAGFSGPQAQDVQPVLAHDLDFSAWEVTPLEVPDSLIAEQLQAGSLPAPQPFRVRDRSTTFPSDRADTNVTNRQVAGEEIRITKLSGNGIKIELPDESFSARLTMATGRDVMRPGQHMLAGALTERNSWHREIDVSFSPQAFSEIGFTITAGASSGRRPSLFGAGSRHGVGELTRWRESNSWDLGISLELPGGGIRYSGGYSWSEHARTWANRFDDPNDLLFPRPDWETGRSFWNKIEADVWKGAETEVTAYAVHGRMDEDFRTIQRYRDTPIYFEGETFEAGSKVKWAKGSAEFRLWQVDGPQVSLSETTGKLKYGPVDLKLTNGSWTVKDQDLRGWIAGDQFWKARARLSLGSLLGGGFGKGFLPDTLNLKYERKRMEDGFIGLRSTREQTKAGVGLSWSRKGSETEIYLSQVETTRPADAVSGVRREREIAIDFFQTLYGDNWDVSVYGSVTDSKSAASSQAYWLGGASVSLQGNDLPKLSVSVDVGDFSTRYPGFAFRGQELSVRATLDLSRYLPETVGGEKPYLHLKAYGDWSLSRESSLGQILDEDTRIEPTAMLVYGMTF